jgi:hypothetical protein
MPSRLAIAAGPISAERLLISAASMLTGRLGSEVAAPPLPAALDRHLRHPWLTPTASPWPTSYGDDSARAPDRIR